MIRSQTLDQRRLEFSGLCQGGRAGCASRIHQCDRDLVADRTMWPNHHFQVAVFPSCMILVVEKVKHTTRDKTRFCTACIRTALEKYYHVRTPDQVRGDGEVDEFVRLNGFAGSHFRHAGLDPASSGAASAVQRVSTLKDLSAVSDLRVCLGMLVLHSVMPDLIWHPVAPLLRCKRVFRAEGLERAGPRIRSGVTGKLATSAARMRWCCGHEFRGRAGNGRCPASRGSLSR